MLLNIQCLFNIEGENGKELTNFPFFWEKSAKILYIIFSFSSSIVDMVLYDYKYLNSITNKIQVVKQQMAI